ncbi:MAG: hypothetical protein ACRD1T_18615, partial [Acidimicrobiia bacterium]
MLIATPEDLAKTSWAGLETLIGHRRRAQQSGDRFSYGSAELGVKLLIAERLEQDEGSKAEQPLQEVPQDVSFVEPSEIESVPHSQNALDQVRA